MNGIPQPLPNSPAETDFLRHWQAAAASAERDPTALALAGGGVADRLAWVFVSGYQAAIRRCFPEYVGAGWACFAVAEPEGGPACALEPVAGGFRLSGRKSWIAGARTIEALVVAVGSDAGRRFALIQRDTPGLSITLPRAPRFLKELSQGAAEFDGVHVPAGSVVADPARAGLFRGAEPLYVLLALNACLNAAAANAGDAEQARRATEAIEAGRVLAGYLGDRSRYAPGLEALKTATMAVVDAASSRLDALPQSLRDSWSADAKLLALFGVRTLR